MKKYFLTFFITSIIFICLSIYGILKPDTGYQTTFGIITRIDEYYDPSSETTYYTPYIDYEVNGIKYKDIEYGAYNSSMKVDDEVKVYYDPSDPTFIQAEGYKKVPYIILTISSLFLLSSIIMSKRF